MINTLAQLQQKVIAFRNQRDWIKFHTPKNLTQAIAVEAGELNDLYLWTRQPDLHRVGEEMADLREITTVVAMNIAVSKDTGG